MDIEKNSPKYISTLAWLLFSLGPFAGWRVVVVFVGRSWDEIIAVRVCGLSLHYVTLHHYWSPGIPGIVIGCCHDGPSQSFDKEERLNDTKKCERF